MTIGIYKITNPKGDIYIGQSKNIENRFKKHKKDHKYGGRKSKLYLSFIEYGFDNHNFDIIEICAQNELNSFERLHQLNFINKGFIILNQVIQGDLDNPTIFMQDVKDKLSKLRKGKKLSEYHIKRISEGKIGIKFSDKHRFNLSESHKINKGGSK